jgi:hypothetical protein
LPFLSRASRSASKPGQIQDAVASLEASFTSRHYFRGVSDDVELARISAGIGARPAAN